MAKTLEVYLERVIQGDFKYLKHRKKLLEFFKATANVLEKVAEYFDIEKKDLFRKTNEQRIAFPRQLCHYQIAEENKKIFKKEYWSLIGRLFDMNHVTIMRNYKIVEDLIYSSNTRGDEIRQALGMRGEIDPIKKFERNRVVEKLTQEQRKQFFKNAYKVGEQISKYFGIKMQDLFNKNINLPQELYYHLITKKNEKIFGNYHSDLTAALFGLNYESILFSYHRIEVLKDVDDSEGKTIREVLKLAA